MGEGGQDGIIRATCVHVCMGNGCLYVYCVQTCLYGCIHGCACVCEGTEIRGWHWVSIFSDLVSRHGSLLKLEFADWLFLASEFQGSDVSASPELELQTNAAMLSLAML